eukprot:TRINITY_DN2733_c0_g1_i1.p1 TRINITY_DN2733_c0_g1~~TRINITY_DN2733_c0_g1_i1.p1  ORF type:complete len:239 (-),score=71.07 TRINITY_DN2733_c0_g1_i1:68-784(-)
MRLSQCLRNIRIRSMRRLRVTNPHKKMSAESSSSETTITSSIEEKPQQQKTETETKPEKVQNNETETEPKSGRRKRRKKKEKKRKSKKNEDGMKSGRKHRRSKKAKRTEENESDSLDEHGNVKIYDRNKMPEKGILKKPGEGPREGIDKVLIDAPEPVPKKHKDKKYEKVEGKKGFVRRKSSFALNVEISESSSESLDIPPEPKSHAIIRRPIGSNEIIRGSGAPEEPTKKKKEKKKK